MAQYREDQNALSLEDRQNIVISRLNQLNEAAARENQPCAEGVALSASGKSGTESGAGFDSRDPAEPVHPVVEGAARRARTAQGAALRTLRRQAPRDADGQRVDPGRDAAAESEIAKAVDSIRHDYESAMLEERTLASALEEQKAIATDLDRKSVTYTVLQRDAEQPRALSDAAPPRKELQVLANSRGNNVRLVERAAFRRRPSAPTCGER